MNLAVAARGGPIVYLAYSDEAGTGNIIDEPILIVAAVVIHPDTQWTNVSEEMERLVSENVEVARQQVFEFHAHKQFARLEKGQNKKLLTGILSIPAKCNVPIFWGAVHREGFRRQFLPPTMSDKDALLMTQGLAFYLCATRVEGAFAPFVPNEKVLWIADRANAAQAMKAFLKMSQSRELVPGVSQSKLEHIIDTIYFGDSHESRALQLADACNFVIKRRLMNNPDIEPYYSLIRFHVNPPVGDAVLFAPDTKATP